MLLARKLYGNRLNAIANNALRMFSASTDGYMTKSRFDLARLHIMHHFI